PDFGCAETGPATLPPYPPLPVRFAPVVPPAGTTPVTWSAPFPRPGDVARGQAQRLGGVADRALDRLLALLAAAEAGSAPDADALLHLRFGDGRAGAVPPQASTLRLWYRLGTGTAGNVGAEAIDTVELCGVAGVTVRVRNPLPATGGVDPEPVAQVRRRAPE